MLIRLDHLVIAVVDPDAAAAELEARVGLSCTGGGRHPAWGTHNRLAWLGDTYIELIGVFDRSLAPAGAVSRAVLAALERGDAGLVSYALATDSVDDDLARLRRGGSDLGDVEARSRTRPDGEVVRWRAAFPAVLGPAEPPFIVEHEPHGAEWGAEARAARARFVHPLGAGARIRNVTLPVPGPDAVAAAYRRTLGLDLTGEPPVARVGEQAVRLVPGRPLVDPAEVEIHVPSAAPVEIEALNLRWRISA